MAFILADYSEPLTLFNLVMGFLLLVRLQVFRPKGCSKYLLTLEHVVTSSLPFLSVNSYTIPASIQWQGSQAPNYTAAPTFPK